MSNITLFARTNFGIVVNLPYALFFAAVSIAHLFRQSRVAMVACAMAFGYWVIQNRLQASLTQSSVLLELCLLVFSLTLCCLLTYLFKNTGVFSRGFILYLLILATCFGCSYLIMNQYQYRRFNLPLENILFVVPELSRLPFILVLYLVALTSVIGILVLCRNNREDTVVFSTMLLVSNTFIFFQVEYISSTMFSLAGILLILNLLLTSHEMAFIDRLTQLPGRQALDLDMRYLRSNFAIAMIDIDHFKNFNDTYGHDTGDDRVRS